MLRSEKCRRSERPNRFSRYCVNSGASARKQSPSGVTTSAANCSGVGTVIRGRRRIEKSRAKANPIVAVARCHPWEARAIVGFDERIHAIACKTCKGDARFFEVLAGHTFHGITANRVDGADALHAVMRRDARWSARRPAEIPAASRVGSILRRPPSRSRAAGRPDCLRRDRSECFRSSSARARAGADRV